MGDFNVIHSLNEKRGRARWWSSWQNDLNNYLIQSSLEDLRFTDSMFTWTNQQSNNLILKKLDRVLVNVKWKCDFAAPKVSFLPFGILNHFSILVNLVEKPKRKVPFKYFNFWANHPQFVQIIAKVWEEKVISTLMFILCKKLKHVKVVL